MKTELFPTQTSESDLHMNIYFETERLIVRRYMLGDIDELFKIMSDIRVHIYTKDKNNPWDKQRTKEYIKCCSAN